MKPLSSFECGQVETFHKPVQRVYVYHSASILWLFWYLEYRFGVQCNVVIIFIVQSAKSQLSKIKWSKDCQITRVPARSARISWGFDWASPFSFERSLDICPRRIVHSPIYKVVVAHASGKRDIVLVLYYIEVESPSRRVFAITDEGEVIGTDVLVPRSNMVHCIRSGAHSCE